MFLSSWEHSTEILFTPPLPSLLPHSFPHSFPRSPLPPPPSSSLLLPSLLAPSPPLPPPPFSAVTSMIEQSQDRSAMDHVLLFAELKAGHSGKAREIGQVCVHACVDVCVHACACEVLVPKYLCTCTCTKCVRPSLHFACKTTPFIWSLL